MDNIVTGAIIGILSAFIASAGLSLIWGRIKYNQEIKFEEYGLVIPSIFLWVTYIILLFQPEWSGKVYSIAAVATHFWLMQPPNNSEEIQTPIDPISAKETATPTHKQKQKPKSSKPFIAQPKLAPKENTSTNHKVISNIVDLGTTVQCNHCREINKLSDRQVRQKKIFHPICKTCLKELPLDES